MQKKKGKEPFSITTEQISQYTYEDGSVSISQFARKVSALTENMNMKRLTYKDISAWLLKNGLLTERGAWNGKMKKYPTEWALKLEFPTSIA